MQRYLDQIILNDLANKVVVLTGPRQVGKTTLSQQIMSRFKHPQYLNWDILGDRSILQKQSWSSQSDLLVMDEIHKMPHWKKWLKGVIVGLQNNQALLVTGNARMDTLRQSGESLAGRYFSLRLHPISVRELVEKEGMTAKLALEQLMVRGGFPEPCLASEPIHADRWRAQYFTDLIREDVLEFSRLQEINTMRLFVEVLRERVGSPLSLASIARDLAVSPMTLKNYLEVLKALFIVFTIPPYHKNIARAILKSPKVYFFDTGLVKGSPGVKLENAVATMLLKKIEFLRDSQGSDVGLHYVRTKDGAEVDFALSHAGELTHLIEVKRSDCKPHNALIRFASQFPQAQAIQLVLNLKQEESLPDIEILDAAKWLACLEA